jgi:hypothetical protein
MISLSCSTKFDIWRIFFLISNKFVKMKNVYPKYTRSILWLQQDQRLKVQWSIKSEREDKEPNLNTSIHSYNDWKNATFKSVSAHSHPSKLRAFHSRQDSTLILNICLAFETLWSWRVMSLEKNESSHSSSFPCVSYSAILPVQAEVLQPFFQCFMICVSAGAYVWHCIWYIYLHWGPKQDHYL